MSETKLPRTIDPLKFAEQHSSLSGTLALSEMSRLDDCHVKQTSGLAKFLLEGGIDQQGFRYLKGKVEAKVKLQCQRCLQPMTYHLKAEFLLSPVHDEKEAEKLPTMYEALYFTQPEVELLKIIEDELLLALPLVLKHPAKECIGAPDFAKLRRGEQHAVPDSEQKKRSHPFAELEKLKKRG
jgi:uncharacterized protein